MNNEIKEILDLLRDTSDLSFFAVCGTKEELENMPKCVSKRLAITDEQAKILLDYITNLQQENEKLKTKTKEQSLLLIDYQDMEQKLEDYKSRIEKAVEYINHLSKDPNVFGHYGIHNDCAKWLLNILNGRR